jgi:hypothetical protein
VGRDLVGLTCPNCGALVGDPGQLAAHDQVLCRFCRQKFVIDHTAGSRVSLIVPHAAFVAPARQRVEQLGFRPGETWTRQSFNGWATDNKHDALLIAVAVQLGPPFAASFWQGTLTRPWPQLVDEIAGARHGQITAISGGGNPVVIVYGQTEYDLRAGIAEAKLDTARAAQSAYKGVAPVEVAIVAPTPSIGALCQARITALGSRPGRAMGRDFAGWQAPDSMHALLVTVCAQFGPPFSAQHWHDYLGRSWPELVDTMGQRRHGQLEAKSPTGARVLVVFGQTEQDLHAAIGALHW